MNAREAYVYMKDIDYETMAAFLRAYADIEVYPIGKDFVRIVVAGDEADFHRLREMTLQEFIQDFTAFLVPESAGFPIDAILPQLPKMAPGVYGIAELIAEIVLLDLAVLRTALKDYYFNLVGNETVETAVGFIRENQNASRAARRLYMHRNTLNYRLDHFTARTGIDVRSFTGALAVYLLYRT
ncbi:MAG: helix-turn-helix domain-containing protein [bacterium]